MILYSAEPRIISCLPTHVINLVINDNSLEILYIELANMILIYFYYLLIFFNFFFFIVSINDTWWLRRSEPALGGAGPNWEQFPSQLAPMSIELGAVPNWEQLV